MDIYKETIGTGALFPIQLSRNSLGQTGWYPVSGTKLIENNLEAIILHTIGSKLRGEEFGSRIYECIEESNSQALSFLINQFLREAFEQWEDRITFKESHLLRTGSKIEVVFIYQLINSSSSSVGKITL